MRWKQGILRYILAGSLLSSLPIFADVIGIVGGQDGTSFYGAFISSSGVATSIGTGIFPITGSASSVAINTSGNALIGGNDSAMMPIVPYGAFISSNGTITSLPLAGLGGGNILSVAINSDSKGLIGGNQNNFVVPYAAFVLSPTVLSPISGLPGSGSIADVAISDAGNGLIAGTGGYAAIVSSGGVATSLVPSLPASVQIEGVAINSVGDGLIGGRDNGGVIAYAAKVSSSGTVTSLSGLPSNTLIQSVSINASGMGIIGGVDNIGNPYAALVSTSNVVTPLLGLPSDFSIFGVAINASGNGLIGGTNGSGGSSFVALVSASGAVTPITLPSPSEVFTVALNNQGTGLVGGDAFPNPDAFAALISPSGTFITITGLPSSGFLNSVAILLQQIPTAGLTGNNLILANYINANSPDTAFYFVPSEFNGTLADALESAAPTRHGFDLFIADNNLFALNNSFTQHVEDTRHYYLFQEKFCADRTADKNKKQEQESGCACELTKRPHQIWFKALGTTFRQKAQHQTPSFQPWIGGAILGFDLHTYADTAYGLGAAYVYSRDHQAQGAGHSYINQEFLFAYAILDSEHFYGDVALWAGLFQIHNTRHIKMTGFDFRASSHPKGWQFAPHAEVGYHHNYSVATFEPFVMLDWVHNWQKAYEEKGSGPFNFGQRPNDSSFLRSEIGLRVYETIEFQTWRLIFQEKGSYVNKKPFDVGDVRAYLVGALGTFTVATLTSPQNLGLVEGKILFESHNPCRPYGSVAYQGEFGPTYQSHQLSLNVGWNF